MSSLLLTSLGIICPSCDHLNAPKTQQCAVCGLAVLPSSPSKASSLPRSTPPVHAAKPSPPVVTQPEPAPSGLRPTRPAGSPATLGPAASPRALVEPAPASESLKRAPAPGATPAAARFSLAVIAGAAKGQRYRLQPGECRLGRSRGNILFPEDIFLSPHHATLTVGEGHLSLRDEASASGVFVSISGQETIARDALFCVGQHLFRYLGKLQPPAPPTPRQPQVYGAPIPAGQVPYGVEEVLVGGRPGKAMVLAGPVLTIGQLHCDLSFPGDEDLASRHCELTPTPQGAILRDLSGALGTFVRVAPSTDRALQTGDRFRIGQQVLQVEPSV